MFVDIRKCAFGEVEGNTCFPALRQEYADECRLAGLPPPTEKLAIYHQLDTQPFFTVFGAFEETSLIGFVALLHPTVPHYGIVIAVAESLFVGKRHRRTGAGLRLIKQAEQYAAEISSPGILFSAPSGGILADVLPRIGYKETNRAFLKVFTHG